MFCPLDEMIREKSPALLDSIKASTAGTPVHTEIIKALSELIRPTEDRGFSLKPPSHTYIPPRMGHPMSMDTPNPGNHVASNANLPDHASANGSSYYCCTFK